MATVISKVYVLMKVESYNKYDLKDVNAIGVYTNIETARKVKNIKIKYYMIKI